MHNVSLHDVFYGIWAIVSVRHMTDGERTAVFAVAGRDRSSRGEDEGIEILDNDFPLLLRIPKHIEVLSLIRHVGAVSAKASSHAHIGYKKILAKASAQSPQVKVAISWPGNSQEVVPGDERFPLVLDIPTSRNLKFSLWHNSTVPERDIRVLLDHLAPST